MPWKIDRIVVMKTVFWMLLLAVTASAASPAMSPAQALEKSRQARALLDQAIEALGGEAFLNLKSEKMEGRVYSFRRDQLTGLATFVSYTRYPDQQREEYGKNKETIMVYSGDQGWEIDIHGVKPVPEEEMEFRRERRSMGAFYILRYRLQEPGILLEYAGRDLLGTQAVDVVNFIDADNRVATFYLDRLTHLPVRVTWIRRDPKTRQRIEEEEILSNYFTGQGVTAPRQITRQRHGAKIFEAFVQKVYYNLPLPDSLFVAREQ